MWLLDCKKLRLTVLLALGLFILGFALQAPRFLLDGHASLVTLLSGIGLVSMVASPFLMLSVALLSLVPSISRRLELCEH